MSRRRELARRLSALSDIAGILSAMKNLALMETLILRDFLASQRRMVAGIEGAAADFLAWHPEPIPAPTGGQGHALCVLVGSEQGFCGDFNERIVAHLQATDATAVPARWVIVGQRLATKLGEDPRTALQLTGASVADEVPAVLLRLTRELNHLLTTGDQAGAGLCVLYLDDASGDLRLRHLLHLGTLPPPATAYPHAPTTNLPPAKLVAGLTRHYLYAALNEVLYSALMAENRQRQAHMDRALQRLDEQTGRLRRVYNAQRQEEITEEIEIILLSADQLSG